MSRIQQAFAQGKAFIPFITCGDPDLETTGKIVRAMRINWQDKVKNLLELSQELNIGDRKSVV